MNILDKIKVILRWLYQTEFGQLGQNQTISDTDTHTGNWCALYVCSATVINSITIDGAADSGLAGVSSWSAGQVIYGNITSVKLTSGVCRLYGGSLALLNAQMNEL